MNTSLLEFYWSLGKDINEKQFQNTYGSGFYKKRSDDMTREIPDTRGFSPRNLSYAYKFYKLYNGILQQDVAKLTLNMLFSVPWGHRQRIIDRGDQKPGIAQQLVKYPYNFDFLTMRQEYDEKELKGALISNIEQFLDLLLYNTKLHDYVVVEVKVKSFEAAFFAQLGAYVSCVDHLLKTGKDSPTIGLLVCKGKDNVFAQYSLDAYKGPLGISEFNGIKFLPETFKSSRLSIEAMENELKHK